MLPVFNALPGANLLLAPDLRIVAASDEYLAATLTQRSTIVGQYLFDAFPDNPQAPEANAVANVRASLAHVLATGQPHDMAPQHYDVPDPAQPGRFVERHWKPRHTPVLDAAGQVRFVIQSVQDITAGCLAERRLRESPAGEQVLGVALDVAERVQARRQNEALQAQVLAAAQRQVQERAALLHILADTPAAVALLRGPEHQFEYVNAAYQQLFPERQLSGRPLAEALPETEAAGFLALLDTVYRTGETFFGTELPMHLAPVGGAAQQVYYTFTYQAYREQGQIAGISIFAFDVTEQVQARQQREAERQQLHQLFMEAPAPIVILDGPDLVFRLVNPAYQRAFPGRVLLGRPVLAALPELAGTPVERALREVYETGRTFVAQEMPLHLARHVGAPLEELYFTFTFQPRRNAQGLVDGITMFGHEVTDQVQARRVVEAGGQKARALAQELSKANEQLVRTNVDLDNFIYTASHDLKAPISNIEGLLSLLQAELPAGVTQQGAISSTLTHMQESVERFKRTIEHLTDVSKLQKEHDTPTTAVDLATIVEDVRQDLLPLMHSISAKLVVDVTDRLAIQFSEKNLRSVVYNLLSNALKYHSPDRPPRVDVRAHVRAGYTVLEVHDNGLGIEPAYQPRLFTMFQRFHTHVEGSGIGLYMVKRMVENAGGRIEVYSQPGAGTTFFVHLPQVPATAA